MVSVGTGAKRGYEGEEQSLECKSFNPIESKRADETSPGSGEKRLKQEKRYQSFGTEIQRQSWRETHRFRYTGKKDTGETHKSLTKVGRQGQRGEVKITTTPQKKTLKLLLFPSKFA